MQPRISMIKNTLYLLLVSFSISHSGLTQAAGEEYLDYGLHWVKMNNGQEQQAKAVNHNGTVISRDSSYYSNAKPTVIYFHGWQNGSSEEGYSRENFEFSDISQNTIAAWKVQGWNVAVFHWNQFADEGEVKDAEAKLWSINGSKGMRYRLDDGSYSTQQSPAISVGEIAFQQISAALANNNSNNIRFAGHSLGNQLAVFVAKQINDGINNGSLNNNIMPNRVELLDPFWSKSGKSYLGDSNGDGQNDWNGEVVKWAIEDLIADQDVAVTWYKTSGIADLLVGDLNTDLESTVAFIHNRFWYLSATDIAGKHVHAPKWYFMSKASDAPEEVSVNWWGKRSKTGYDAASASTSNNRIKFMMGNSYHWDQVEGRYTADPADDQFEVKNY
ncbi:MAG: hypothetical protein ACI9OH_000918 [Oleispira sp.]|jgi:hypothetical protein